jgi:MFS family permease
VIGMILVCVLFRDHKPEADDVAMPRFNVKNANKGPGSLFFNSGINVFMLFVFGVAQWGITSQLFSFAAAQYKLIATQYNIWISFIGVGAGAMGFSIFWRRVAKRLRQDHPTQELQWTLLGATLSVGAMVCFLNYTGGSVAPPSGLFYAGTVLLGLSTTCFYANSELIYSKQLTQYTAEVGSSVGMFYSVYGIAASLARFLGPFLAGFTMVIANAAENNAAPCVDSQGAFDVNSTCCFTPTSFSTSTCEILNVNIWVGLSIGIAVTMWALTWWYTTRLVNYHGFVEGSDLPKPSPNPELNTV